ncbi:MAG: NUDIX domain-containing protein [Pseudonocardiaceae bacterium]
MVRSAGAILFELDDGVLKVLIAHMGGPFWAKKDERAWSIPKGEYDDGEDPQAAAAREFSEEMGSPLPAGELVELGTITQSGGKRITAYALESGFDPAGVRSNLFEMEWPRGSGTLRSFPEVDRAEWFDCATTRAKLVSGQVVFLDRLLEHVRGQGRTVREA